MLKITRDGISLLVPKHWISSNGFLKHRAVHAIKLFFGDETLEKALEEGDRDIRYSWTFGKTLMKKGAKRVVSVK